MRVIKKIEIRKFKYGCGVVTQNFLLNYSLFKITINLSKNFRLKNKKICPTTVNKLCDSLRPDTAG